MFSDPLKNLKQLGLREDMIVADLGAGTGFYSILAAQIVTRGKVYAIEIQKDFLTTIKNKAKDLFLKNLDILWCDIEKEHGTKIGDSVVDAVIISNVLFQVENKDRFIKEAKRILKDGGLVLFIDWHDNPPMFNQKKKDMITREYALEIFGDNGFALERDIDAGAHHYGIIFKKINTQ